MKVLDVSAGERHVWFNKSHPDATFLDIRPEVNPDVIGDSRDLSQFADGTFDLVVFDPPHGNIGPNGAMRKRYGSFDMDYIRDLIIRSDVELHRVLTPGGLLAFKWNDRQIGLVTVLSYLSSFEPLFGHHVSSAQARPSTTYWVMLKKRCTATEPLWDAPTAGESIPSTSRASSAALRHPEGSAPMTIPTDADAQLARIKAEIAVARQVGDDGYWTMKASDGAFLLDRIAALLDGKAAAERDLAQRDKDVTMWKTRLLASLRETLRERGLHIQGLQDERADLRTSLTRAEERVAELESEETAESRLYDAVIAIWKHTVQHTTYVEGVGYTSRSDQQVCHDPAEHARLAAEEGAAYHDLAARAALPAQPKP